MPAAPRSCHARNFKPLRVLDLDGVRKSTFLKERRINKFKNDLVNIYKTMQMNVNVFMDEEAGRMEDKMYSYWTQLRKDTIDATREQKWKKIFDDEKYMEKNNTFLDKMNHP